MVPEKIFIGILLVGIGLVFFFNNEQIAKGAYKFYQKLYTEKNLKVMFKACGVVLMVGGVVVALVKK